jgi:hypothetical protein
MYFGCLGLYFGCLDLHLWRAGLVFWMSGLVCWVSELVYMLIPGLVFGCVGLYCWCLGLLCERQDLYVGCLDLRFRQYLLLKKSSVGCLDLCLLCHLQPRPMVIGRPFMLRGSTFLVVLDPLSPSEFLKPQFLSSNFCQFFTPKFES